MSILVVTNSDDPTADYVQNRMEEMGVAFVRFNTDQALLEMAHSFEEKPELMINGSAVSLDEVTGVWYRRPKTPSAPPILESPQAKTYAEEEAYYYLKCLWMYLMNKTWVSHPWAISWANVKLHQLSRAKMVGLVTPRSIATNVPAKARKFIEELSGKVVVKPFKHNVLTYDDETAVVFTSRVTHEDYSKLDSVRNAITFLQEEIEKDSDVRVTIIGQKVFAAEISSEGDTETKLDWRRTSPNPGTWRIHNLPRTVAEKCISLTSMYGLNFSAIDLAKTPSGEYVFFELNPNGQWAWLEIELGLPMTESLIRLLTCQGTLGP